MKELLKQYASYNLWANQRLIDTILSMSAEKHRQELNSSFKSLYDTVQHMWNAESIWWQRIKLSERLTIPSDIFSGTMEELTKEFLLQNQMWVDYTAYVSDAGLEHVFQYYDTKREHFKQPVFQVLLHVFNHSTYHRGQLVTLMRQLGVEKLPSTDFVLWTRRR